MKKFAVISFPGTNCEAETVRAFKRHGMDAEVVLWNDQGLLEGDRLDEFDGYCLPGGFSYEDRGRSAIVAAQDPIMEMVKAEADRGKVVLGICNGAQMLVETGLIPGYDNKALTMGLGWNEMRVEDRVLDTGFRNEWVYLKNVAPKGRSAFNDFEDLLHVPLANGEGRFVIPSELLKVLESNHQIIFKYSDASGQISSEYPVTPNGAVDGVAAVCNPAGNVMAIMPHPERDPNGSGELIFDSIKRYFERDSKTEYASLGQGQVTDEIQPKKSYDVEFYIRLIITDNAERTIEEALLRKGLSLHLDRFEFYGINLASGVSAEEAIARIMQSGELANFNKHLVFVRTSEGVFQYEATKGLKSATLNLDHTVITSDDKDFMGQSKKAAINAHSGHLIQTMDYGVLWHFSETDEVTIKKAIDSHVLHNPYSMVLYRSND